MNSKTFMFNIRLPTMKLIGINENKRFIKKVLELILFKDSIIISNIKYNLHYFNINMVLSFFMNFLIINIIAPVAQLDRALGYGPGGSGFKS